MTEGRCRGCGAVAGAADRFCSQCGRREPLRAAGDPTTPLAPAATRPLPDVARSPDLGALGPGRNFARRYRIERLLGEGGMGRVYLALDNSIYEWIALKVLSAAYRSNPAVLEQFKHELKLARKVRHRNVVASFHLGESEGFSYLTQEYIESENLSAFMERRGTLDEAEALRLLRQVLRGLKAAHDLGIVHRDIKAGNVLVNKEGMAFITDFGLASSANQNDALRGAGTPRYMAPELFEGAPGTPASDFYACGVVLFLMLTGRYPFAGSEYDELRLAHRDLTPDPIPADIGASRATRALYTRLLAKNEIERPQQAVEVLDVVEGVLALDALKVKTDRPIALVGDADEAVRRVAGQALERQGYHVEAAGTADEVVTRAFSATPSLIVLDSNIEGGQQIAPSHDALTMAVAESVPQHRALGLCRLLQQDGRLKHVPMLVVVATDHPEVASAFRLMGASEVIRKPFTLDGFAESVARARQNSLAKADES
jgi:CheY-like chemotaxis protein